VQESFPEAASFISAGEMSTEAFGRLLGRAGYITCPQTDLLPPAMPQARDAIASLDAEEILGLRESSVLAEDLAVLWACYNKAAIPNMYINFLRNYREDKGFWPNLYTGHTREGMKRVERADAETRKALSPAHVEIEAMIGHQGLLHMVKLQRSINEMEDRINSQAESRDIFAMEESSEPHAFPRRLSPTTLAAMDERLKALQSQLSRQKEEVGVSFKHASVIDDVVHNAMI
jgi:hypothetical protein